MKREEGMRYEWDTNVNHAKFETFWARVRQRSKELKFSQKV